MIDKETKKPVETEVSLFGEQNIDVYSNSNGEYWIGGFNPGKYEISIRGKFDSINKEHKYFESIIVVALNEKKEFNVEI